MEIAADTERALLSVAVIILLPQSWKQLPDTKFVI